jgi:hypothetical protein
MEQNALKNVSICSNTNIYLETSGGQSSNLYLNVVHFFNAIRHLWQLKTVCFSALVSNMCCSIDLVKFRSDFKNTF